MALFVAHHQHSAETCPAKDPQMGQMLLQHLSPETAQQHGITIHGEAVLDGRHTLYLIVDAPDRQALENYLQPFAMAGSVDIQQASACTAVIERGGCDPRSL